MKWPFPVALGFSLLLALILRVPDLDQRPFHNDEAVNAIIFQQLLEQGVYQYDPDEHHGPLLQYATLALARLTNWESFEATTEASFRWLNVLVGMALIPLLWLTRDALGRPATVWAGLLTAISPSLTFYSRDYIHESLLVTGTFLLIGCLWRYSRRPNWGWAAAAGLALAWMHATKETFVLNVAALVLAAAGLMLWARWEASERKPLWCGAYWHGLVAIAAWIGVAALLFSSFGMNPGGPGDSVRTYLPWLSRAGGESPHIHPYWFYWERLFWRGSGAILPWTELGILLFALVGGIAAFLRRGLGGASAGFVRWLALYTILLFVGYSTIPYKTPWCILSAAHGIVMLAGVGMAVVWRGAWRSRQRLAAAAVTILVLGHISWQAWVISHTEVSSRHNPWAYADTVPDIRNLIERVDAVTAGDPEGRGLHVQVICEDDDYWPLPYYLRAHKRVGWWSSLPGPPLAPILVVSPEILNDFPFESQYISTGYFQVRHGVFRACLVEHGLWNEFLDARESDGL